MKKFEYIVENLSNDVDFNGLGAKGLELASCYNSRAYFKREIEQETIPDVTVEQVLRDIESGKTVVSTRIRVMLQWTKAVHLREVTLPVRNFGQKTKTEWIELNNKYYGSSRSKV